MTERNFTYWDAKEGGIGVSVESIPSPGKGTFKTNPPPADAKLLSVEEAIEAVMDSYASAKKRHEADETVRKNSADAEIAEREGRIEELVEKGISRETAEAMLPPTHPYTPAPFSLPGGWQQHLGDAYGFNRQQIARIGASIED